MRRDPRYFNTNTLTKICSDHFVREDFIEPDAFKKRLKEKAVPSVFHWTKTKQTSERSYVVEKLNTSRIEEEEATDSI